MLCGYGNLEFPIELNIQRLCTRLLKEQSCQTCFQLIPIMSKFNRQQQLWKPSGNITSIANIITVCAKNI